MKYSLLKKVIDIMSFAPDKKRGVTELADQMSKTTMTIHKYLNALVERGEVLKHPNGSHTTYSLSTTVAASAFVPVLTQELELIRIPYQTQELLERNFFKLGTTGRPYEGYQGFVQWCAERKLNILEKSEEYAAIINYHDSLRTGCGLLDATQILQQKIEGSALNALYYADQYTYPNFGRGKLAEMTFYAKSTENKPLMRKSIALMQRKLQCLIDTSNIDAIAVAPHSINRRVQLLPTLMKTIDTTGKTILVLTKYSPSGIPIPQKSLKKREDRIRNARETIVIEEYDISAYAHILLIDDFVGSGSTLNETAKKLKAAGATKVTGFAFVGNLNLSYDVIREM